MLYIVGTPIGNLEDMSYRAVNTLKEADLIAAEDTRHTLKLLNHFDIKTPLTSYHEHNKASKGAQLIEKLIGGADIAIVTDAGMPAISDPGEDLVRQCIENGVEITVIPGPTAFVTALVMSGFSTTEFIFAGFLSAKASERRAKLEQLKGESRTMIFYEAPHRLLKTLNAMSEHFGDRNIAVCRELTKKYEQVLRLTISRAIEHFTEKEPKGEFVIVAEGAIQEQQVFELAVTEHVDEMIKSGMDKKEAIAYVAKLRNLPKRDVYNEYLGGTRNSKGQ